MKVGRKVQMMTSYLLLTCQAFLNSSTNNNDDDDDENNDIF